MKSRIRRVIITAVMFGTYFFSSAQTTLNSIISSNQTWTVAGSPYILSANAVIQSGAKVTIEPGVTIRSTARNLRIIVDGTIEAVGTKDSAIVCQEFYFDLTSKCVDYDTATGNGCQFKYCLFDGNGAGGSYALKTDNTTLLIRNCKFLDGYYNIYVRNSSKDTNDLYIEKSTFENTTSSFGYAMYASGGYSLKLHMSDCYVNNMYGVYIPQWASVKRCSFTNIRTMGISQTTTQYLSLECNLFQNFQGTALSLSNPQSTAEISIHENTFDSCNTFFRLRVGSRYRPAKFDVYNNNFLSFVTNSVEVYGSGVAGVADTISFAKNYWGTTTSANISAGIKDFVDDITIAGYVDHSNHLSSKVTTCTDGSSIGGADTTGVDGSVSVAEYTINDVRVYPNPASDVVSIESNFEAKEIRILSLNGTTVQAKSANGDVTDLNVADLSSGIYLLNVIGDQQSITTRMMITH